MEEHAHGIAAGFVLYGLSRDQGGEVAPDREILQVADERVDGAVAGIVGFQEGGLEVEDLVLVIDAGAQQDVPDRVRAVIFYKVEIEQVGFSLEEITYPGDVGLDVGGDMGEGTVALDAEHGQVQFGKFAVQAVAAAAFLRLEVGQGCEREAGGGIYAAQHAFGRAVEEGAAGLDPVEIAAEGLQAVDAERIQGGLREAGPEHGTGAGVQCDGAEGVGSEDAAEVEVAQAQAGADLDGAPLVQQVAQITFEVGITLVRGQFSGEFQLVQRTLGLELKGHRDVPEEVAEIDLRARGDPGDERGQFARRGREVLYAGVQHHPVDVRQAGAGAVHDGTDPGAGLGEAEFVDVEVADISIHTAAFDVQDGAGPAEDPREIGEGLQGQAGRLQFGIEPHFFQEILKGDGPGIGH